MTCKTGYENVCVYNINKVDIKISILFNLTLTTHTANILCKSLSITRHDAHKYNTNTQLLILNNGNPSI